MHMKGVIVAALGLLSYSSSLWAGTTQCADATASLQYYLSTPDGGAPRPPIEYWTFEGETYATECDLDNGFPCATHISVELDKECPLFQKQHGKPGYGNAWFERVYTVRAKLSLAGGGKVLTDSFLICRQSYYNGLPRP